MSRRTDELMARMSSFQLATQLAYYEDLTHSRQEQCDVMEQRLKMSQRMCMSYQEERVTLCNQLYKHGLMIDGEGNVVPLPKALSPEQN